MLVSAGVLAVLLVGCVLFYGIVEWWCDQDVELLDAQPSADRGDQSSPFASPTSGDGSEAPEIRPFATDLSAALDIGGGISAGHDAFQRALGPMFVGGWIMAILDSNGSGGGGGDDSGSSGSSGSFGLLQAAPDDLGGLEALGVLGLALGALVFVAFCWGVMLLIRAWISPGWIRLHRDLLQTHRSSFGTLFGATDALVSMLLWRLLRAVVLLPALALALGPFVLWIAALETDALGEIPLWFPFTGLMLGLALAVYVGPALFFGDFFVALDGDGPVVALKRSWRAARGNRFGLIVFYVAVAIVQFLAVVLGVLMLCVGLLVTIPWGRSLSDVAWCRAWLIARHGPDAMIDWGPAEG